MATRIGLEPTTPSVTGWCSNQLSYRAIPEQLLLLLNGAADEARTRYLHLGKVALYQMSYGRTFHLFVPGFRPATLVIIPHTPAVVNHKFTFFQKRMSFCSDTFFFILCAAPHPPLFTSFRTAVCTSKIQLLSILQTIIIKRTLCQTENAPARVQLPFIEKKKELPAKRS